MGYRETTGILLRRQNVFEDDQEVSLLTPRGVLSARAPHAQRSQKTFCGRLEPPNRVRTRLYRSREHSDWIISLVTLEDVFASLLRSETVQSRLWPLLSLFRDLFPEGETPGNCLPRLHKGLQYLRKGFTPAGLITNRILVKVANRTGVAFPLGNCAKCGANLTNQNKNRSVWIAPTLGALCGNCQERREAGSTSWILSQGGLGLLRVLLNRTWSEVRDQKVSLRQINDLEEILYRLFHYHFEISLETLQVRRSLR